MDYVTITTQEIKCWWKAWKDPGVLGVGVSMLACYENRRQGIVRCCMCAEGEKAAEMAASLGEMFNLASRQEGKDCPARNAGKLPLALNKKRRKR